MELKKNTTNSKGRADGISQVVDLKPPDQADKQEWRKSEKSPF